MAMKSDNTKGNPYHDDGGKFTSADGQGGGGNTSAEEKVRSMGFDESNSGNKNKHYLDELNKYGETIVGENGDRVYSVTTDGKKFYGISYRTNYNGPIEGTEEEYDDGYDSFEEAINAFKKSGYPLYNDLGGK